MKRESILARTRMPDVLHLLRIGAPTSPRKLVRCPLHADGTPSLRVFDRGFVCFGCGARGGVFDFLVRLGVAQDRASAACWLEERLR